MIEMFSPMHYDLTYSAIKKEIRPSPAEVRFLGVMEFFGNGQDKRICLGETKTTMEHFELTNFSMEKLEGKRHTYKSHYSSTPQGPLPVITATP